MNEERRLIMRLLKLFDLAIVVFAFALTTILTVRTEQQLSLIQFLSIRTTVANFGIFILALCACILTFQLSGLYKSRRPFSLSGEILVVLKAAALNTVCFLAFSSLFSIEMISMRFLLIFWIVSTAVLSLARLTLRLVAAQIRIRGKDPRLILLIGTNPRAVEFARGLLENPGRGYRLLGFVDDDWPGMSAFEKTGFAVVSNFAGLTEFLRRNVVDEVAIYFPFGSFYQHSSEVANLCEQHGITMRFSSDLFGLKGTRWRAEEFGEDHHIATYTGSSELWPRTMKRMLDVTGALCAVLILSPILVAAACAIKLISTGPVFFLQERVGLNKRRFKILKFRTMIPDAEKLMPSIERYNEVTGPVFKMKNDPRITRVGKFLRRSSIDELPQLLNVLSGDMSLVGPRPLPVRDYEGFSVDWQRRRFSVKPGITCLWQVNGRSGISFDEWMLLDLQYMDQWSLWLDLKILVKTVPSVLRGLGAV
jgi:exopolysaccharide biosynthesis polyprenyl glycosylphosphotransferase